MREQRLVFGEDAELYDRARPSYPTELVDEVVALVGSNARAADIGCGTGKATVLLAERGLSGAAVDADPSMAGVAERNLAPYKEWRVYVSDFEKWQPAPELMPFDLVCSAQAWHWLDPNMRIRKAHELLRDGGWLALWWNGAASESEVTRGINAIYAEFAPEIAERSGIRRSDPHLHDVPEELGFSSPVAKEYAWAKEYSADDWVSLLNTQSDHRLLDPKLREELLGRVHAFLVQNGGTYRHDYLCRLWLAQKEGPGTGLCA